MAIRIKLRICRIFRSCRPRNISDVTNQPLFVPHHHSHSFRLFSPKPPPCSSINRPKPSETPKTVKKLCPRRKTSDRNTLLVLADNEGRKCPPASPITPLNTPHKFETFSTNSKQRKPKKKTNKTTHNKKCDTAQYYKGWFSSDEDDETTPFSSKSMSSNSSDQTFYHNNRGRKSGTTRGRRLDRMRVLEGRVKDSLAAVTSSSDPYNDFRKSMVEMIVEREIFGARELQNLLHCYLSLNSYHHYSVIVEVFTEICNALFSN